MQIEIINDELRMMGTHSRAIMTYDETSHDEVLCSIDKS